MEKSTEVTVTDLQVRRSARKGTRRHLRDDTSDDDSDQVVSRGQSHDFEEPVNVARSENDSELSDLSSPPSSITLSPYSPGGEGHVPQATVSPKKRRTFKIAEKWSAPNEHGIVIEETGEKGSLPLSISKKRPPPAKACKAKKVSTSLLAYLGVPSGKLPLSSVADKGHDSTLPPTDSPRKANAESQRPLPSKANASAPSSRPARPATIQEPKIDGMPPVRASGIKASTFASVMRIVSGICPLQNSSRTNRFQRPSAAPPVWAQVREPKCWLS